MKNVLILISGIMIGILIVWGFSSKGEETSIEVLPAEVAQVATQDPQEETTPLVSNQSESEEKTCGTSCGDRVTVRVNGDHNVVIFGNDNTVETARVTRRAESQRTTTRRVRATEIARAPVVTPRPTPQPMIVAAPSHVPQLDFTPSQFPEYTFREERRGCGAGCVIGGVLLGAALYHVLDGSGSSAGGPIVPPPGIPGGGPVIPLPSGPVIPIP